MCANVKKSCQVKHLILFDGSGGRRWRQKCRMREITRNYRDARPLKITYEMLSIYLQFSYESDVVDGDDAFSQSLFVHIEWIKKESTSNGVLVCSYISHMQSWLFHSIDDFVIFIGKKGTEMKFTLFKLKQRRNE